MDSVKTKKLKDALVPYLFVGPSFLYMTFFLLIPTILAIKLSFSHPILPGGFPTLETWKYITGRPQYFSSIKLTIFYAFTTITLETVLGLFIAVVLNMKFRGRGVLRTIVILPLSVPLLVAASAVVVMMMQNGTLNGVLWDWLHLTKNPFPFMVSKIPIIFSEVWKVTPYPALIILAGLEGIPDSFYEAARTMGANTWQQFTKITLPLAWPAIVAAFGLRLAEVYKMFAFPVLVGRAGQGDVLSVLSWKAHEAASQALRPQSVASAYALSMVMLAMLSLLVVGGIYGSYQWVKKRSELKDAK